MFIFTIVACCLINQVAVKGYSSGVREISLKPSAQDESKNSRSRENAVENSVLDFLTQEECKKNRHRENTVENSFIDFHTKDESKYSRSRENAVENSVLNIHTQEEFKKIRPRENAVENSVLNTHTQEESKYFPSHENSIVLNRTEQESTFPLTENLYDDQNRSLGWKINVVNQNKPVLLTILVGIKSEGLPQGVGLGAKGNASIPMEGFEENVSTILAAGSPENAARKIWTDKHLKEVVIKRERPG